MSCSFYLYFWWQHQHPPVQTHVAPSSLIIGRGLNDPEFKSQHTASWSYWVYAILSDSISLYDSLVSILCNSDQHLFCPFASPGVPSMLSDFMCSLLNLVGFLHWLLQCWVSLLWYYRCVHHAFCWLLFYLWFVWFYFRAVYAHCDKSVSLIVIFYCWCDIIFLMFVLCLLFILFVHVFYILLFGGTLILVLIFMSVFLFGVYYCGGIFVLGGVVFQVILWIVFKFIIIVIIIFYLSYTLKCKGEACVCMHESFKHMHLVDDVFWSLSGNSKIL